MKNRKDLEKLNVAKTICNHLVGKEHTKNHRIFTGIILMIFGVGLTVIAKSFASSIIHFIGDAIGYLLHGLGGYPIVEAAVNSGKTKNSKQINNEQD